LQWGEHPRAISVDCTRDPFTCNPEAASLNLVHTFLTLCAVSAVAGAARARSKATRTLEPTEGQRGKDAPWVPTPPALVEAMLDLAGVTSDDYVVDPGCGDGRIVIAAAKRGARALGIEYDGGLIAVCRESALRAGVEDRAAFVQGDLYAAQLREATVLTLFLLPENLRALEPVLSKLKPGTRVVTNRFAIEGWTPKELRRLGGHSQSCCTALLYVVPRR
jgi:precorrin-6B methylase 2